ncbi:MAG: hypothetical protein JXR97_05685, partial [Planctomycetes bacterium]|nr:hypothetical protein [Planctomycetota bacterium]
MSVQSSGIIQGSASRERFNSRAAVLLGLLMLVFAFMAVRLSYLQYVGHNEYLNESETQMESKIHWSPWRGRIVDAKNRVMAASVRIHSCAIDPKVIREDGIGIEDTINFLAQKLKLEPVEIQKIRDRATRVIVRNGEPREVRFVWIKRMLDDDEYNSLVSGIAEYNETAAGEESAEEVRRISGITFPFEYKRRYPQGSLGAHCIGFVNIDGEG